MANQQMKPIATRLPFHIRKVIKVYSFLAKINYDHLSQIDTTRSLSELSTSFELHEDMFQGQYADGTLIDVGWYGPRGDTGVFRINLVRNFDWDNPLLDWQARSFEELMDALKAIDKWANRYCK
jgi:hypothetical protein